MKRAFVLLIPMALAVVGCASPVPVAQNFGLAYQKVARTAQHWDVIADDVVEQTIDVLEDSKTLEGRALYVSPPEQRTAFNRAFREFMITRLVNEGAAVNVCKSESPKGEGFVSAGPDLQVTYDSQVIAHRAPMPDYEPGKHTALAAGILVVRRLAEVSLNSLEAGALLLTAAAGKDIADGREAAPTAAEVVVTTTVSDGNRIVVRRSDVYYVPLFDAQLFYQWGGAKKYRCPGDETADGTSAEHNAADVAYVKVEKARADMVVREMRRVNSSWRPIFVLEKPRALEQIPPYSY